MSDNILFDPHCEKSTNVKTDTVAINTFHGRWKCFVFPKGPAFHSTLVVSHNGKVLKEGVDYYTGHTYYRGTHITGRPLVGSIWSIADGITGQLTIKASYLGGEYVVSTAAIKTYLAERFVSPDKDLWELVMNGDKYFPDVSIKFDIDNWSGESALVDAITNVAESKASVPVTDSPLWQSLNDRLNRLTSAVNSSDFLEHVQNMNNPHLSQHWQSGSLQKDASAVNAILGYGKSITELLKYINDTGVNLTDLARYINRNEETLVSGNIELTDTHCIIKSTGSAKAEIDLCHGSVRLTADNDIDIQCGEVDDGNVIITAGMNKLRIAHTSSSNNMDLYLNDQRVLTVANLMDSNPEISVPDLCIEHQPTSSYVLEGTGTAELPLTGRVVLPVPSSTTLGAPLLTSNSDVNDSNIGATPKLLNTVSKKITTFLPRDAKVNMMPIVQNPIVTKDMLALSNVSNTSDIDKPLTVLTKEEFDKLSLTSHTHTSRDLIFDAATETVKGAACAEIFDAGDDCALAAGFAPKLLERLANLQLGISNSVPNYVLDAKKFYFEDKKNEEKVIDIVDNKIITTVDGHFYSNQKWYTFQAGEIPIVPEGNHVDYLLLAKCNNALPDDAQMFTISACGAGHVPDTYTNGTIVGRVHRTGNSLTLKSVNLNILRLGGFREMDEHINAIDAHDFNYHKFNKHSIGLGSMENYGCIDNYSQLGSHNNYVSAQCMLSKLGISRHVIRSGLVLSSIPISAIKLDKNPHWIATPVNLHSVSPTLNLSNVTIDLEMNNSSPEFIVKETESGKKLNNVELNYVIAYPIN